jgi:Carboxypeptidase regulatory-like domain
MRWVCLLLFSFAAFGQVGSGTITGTVTDQAGAVVPGATVEARNSATGVIFRGVSTNAGNYAIPDLPVGTYVVTVKMLPAYSASAQPGADAIQEVAFQTSNYAPAYSVRTSSVVTTSSVTRCARA